MRKVALSLCEEEKRAMLVIVGTSRLHSEVVSYDSGYPGLCEKRVLPEP